MAITNLNLVYDREPVTDSTAANIHTQFPKLQLGASIGIQGAREQRPRFWHFHERHYKGHLRARSR